MGIIRFCNDTKGVKLLWEQEPHVVMQQEPHVVMQQEPHVVIS